MGKKGKGRQCGGFASKSERAQFQKEWQSKVGKVVDKRRKEQQHFRKEKEAQRRALRDPTRPRIQLTSLQRLIENRQYDDQYENRMLQQRAMDERKKMRTVKNSPISPAGTMVYYDEQQYSYNTQEEEEDDDSRFGKEFRVVVPNNNSNESTIISSSPTSRSSISTLQALCLEALAPVLQDYLDVLGSQQLYSYLSFLPGPALGVLSVLVSQSTGMTADLLPLLGKHTQLTRLSVVAPKLDDEMDPNWKVLTNESIEKHLIPTFGHRSFVPDSWEDELDSIHDNLELLEWKGCIKLQRLELGNIPHLSCDILLQLLETCASLTHLGLSGTMSYDSGPELLWKLATVAPKLQVLDLSANPWVNETLLSIVQDSYEKQHDRIIVIKAAGCTGIAQSSQILMNINNNNNSNDSAIHAAAAATTAEYVSLEEASAIAELRLHPFFS